MPLYEFDIDDLSRAEFILNPWGASFHNAGADLTLESPVVVDGSGGFKDVAGNWSPVNPQTLFGGFTLLEGGQIRNDGGVRPLVVMAVCEMTLRFSPSDDDCSIALALGGGPLSDSVARKQLVSDMGQNFVICWSGSIADGGVIRLQANNDDTNADVRISAATLIVFARPDKLN